MGQSGRPPQKCSVLPFSGMTSASGAAAIMQIVNNQLPCEVSVHQGRNRPFDTLTVTDPPRHGTVTVKGSSFSYMPAAGFAGEDTFKIVSSPSGRILGRVTVTLP
jgi:hypothetical protein